MLQVIGLQNSRRNTKQKISRITKENYFNSCTILPNNWSWSINVITASSATSLSCVAWCTTGSCVDAWRLYCCFRFTTFLNLQQKNIYKEKLVVKTKQRVQLMLTVSFKIFFCVGFVLGYWKLKCDKIKWFGCNTIQWIFNSWPSILTQTI